MITEITKNIDSDEPSRSDLARSRLLRTEGGPFLRNDWEDVVMVHYEVEPRALAPFVPFELDTYDGKAYVSLVSFTMRQLRPRFGGRIMSWLFSPIANHEFLNVRTYVRHEGEHGIYFLAEWLPNRWSVMLGPWSYGLPYRSGRFHYDCRENPHRSASAGPNEWKYRTQIPRDGSLEPVERESLTEFLLERYTAFTDRGCRAGFFRIWHEPWQQTPVAVTVEEDSLPASTGRWFQHARLIGANYSPGVRDVWIGRPRVLPRTGRAFLPDQSRRRDGQERPSYLGWLPIALFPLASLFLRSSLPAWAFMWLLAFAIYAGCKWLTWWQAAARANPWRQLGYLLFWPGMDARAFLDSRTHPARPSASEWLFAAVKTLLGATLLWGVARLLPAGHPLLVGWTGMIGIIFLLHFGSFHLLALIWQSLGVDARPLMQAPILARSLREFWGRRWNAGFHDLAQRFLFAPLRPRLGGVGAPLAVFLASGLIHELVISVPAGAGFGLPTAYFLLQGVALAAQGKRTSRAFTLLVTAVPAIWLFHPPFVERVIIPFLRAIGAL